MPKKMWSFFQGLGKTFMLPVALLAFMGILLGSGSSFTSSATLDLLPVLRHPILQVIFKFMETLGSFAFVYLPVMFAMAIPLGLAKQDRGVAAFSGFVGYMIVQLFTSFYLSETGTLATTETMKQVGQTMILGVQAMDTGVLGGIIVGIIVYFLHEKFYTIQLPDALSFFGGPRFVPIITSLCCAVLGIIFPLVWPIFARGIQAIGQVISLSGIFGPFLFGAGERLLLPFGLHHILVAMIRFTDAGGHQTVCNESVSGALNIYYAQLRCNVPFDPTVTQFLSQGKMPSFLFGLPAAALAMYHSAYQTKKSRVKGILLSGVIACIFAGITEPIEFLFLFISPMLYLIHVIYTGLGFMLMGILQVTIGNTDGNLIDFIIFGVLQGPTTKWFLVPIVGLVWFALYYYTFKFCILKWDLKLLGREDEEPMDEEATGKHVNLSASQQATKILVGLGGSENIEHLDNCITRLRLVVKNSSLIDEPLLLEAGAIGIMKLDAYNIQVIIGPQVAALRQQLEKIM